MIKFSHLCLFLQVFSKILFSQKGYGQVHPNTSNLPHLASGKLERMTAFPSKYVEPRTVDVWLPSDYSPKKKYAVLYMHDGQMLFDTSKTWNHQEWGVDETAGKLIRQKKVMPFIVVGIWNVPHIRYADYFPEKAFSQLDDDSREKVLALGKTNFGKTLPGGKPQSDDYLRFIVEELKPAIDAKYSTYPDPGHTFILGSSMGGLISMYALCEYPQVFGGAGCLSTHWSGIFNSSTFGVGNAFLSYLADHAPDPINHRMYFDLGTATLDSLYLRFQIKADSIMKSKGYKPTAFMTKKFAGDAHTEVAWAKRLHIPFTFLMARPVPSKKKKQENQPKK